MCGFWNGGLAVVMGSRAVGLTGGFAKFNLSALRLPVKEKEKKTLSSDCFAKDNGDLIYVLYLKTKSEFNRKHAERNEYGNN